MFYADFELLTILVVNFRKAKDFSSTIFYFGRDHSFSMYTEFPKKLTLINPLMRTRVCGKKC